MVEEDIVEIALIFQHYPQFTDFQKPWIETCGLPVKETNGTVRQKKNVSKCDIEMTQDWFDLCEQQFFITMS